MFPLFFHFMCIVLSLQLILEVELWDNRLPCVFHKPFLWVIPTLHIRFLPWSHAFPHSGISSANILPMICYSFSLNICPTKYDLFPVSRYLLRQQVKHQNEKIWDYDPYIKENIRHLSFCAWHSSFNIVFSSSTSLYKYFSIPYMQVIHYWV